jgi:hypothetical protein
MSTASDENIRLSSTKFCAVARPMLLFPPVMTADFPSGMFVIFPVISMIYVFNIFSFPAWESYIKFDA